MRLRRTIWILICLLLAAGAWLFWWHPARKGVSTNHPQPATAAVPARPLMHLVPTKISSSPFLPLSVTATNTPSSAAKTNRFAYRVKNTAKTIAELQDDPRAILLNNAFIDTRMPLNLSLPKSLQSKGDPGAYIVQAGGPVNDSFRAMLKSAGAQIVSYIPNNAYLVRASSGAVSAIASVRGANVTVIPYEPQFKLSPSFLTAMAENNYEEPLAVSQMRVAAYPDSANEAKADLEKSGAQIIAQEDSPFGVVFTVQSVRDVAAVARMSSVQLIEPFHTRVLANDLARVTMGISTNTTTLTNWMGLSGSNVIVAVNDSGIDASHPDFAVTGRAGSPGPNPPTRVLGDAIQSLVDTSGHGTHVAGIIAGNGGESYTLGITNSEPRGSVTNADFRGKAPSAYLYSVGFLGSDTNIISDRYLQETAAKTNALISNNSWVLDGDNQYDLSAASFDAAVRDALPSVIGSQPVLFVFAAGNDGGGNDNGGAGNSDTILSPSTAKDVIAVGALEQLRNITNIVTDANSNKAAIWQPMTDTANQVAGYSARGNVGVGTEGTFGRFKPDVVAPGSWVVSARSGQWDTNAYYNPTNYQIVSITDIVTTNDLNSYAVSVPANAVEVDVFVTPNTNSPNPFPNFPIYVALTGIPSPTNFDIATSNNQVRIPPDSGVNITGIQSIANGGFNFSVQDGTNIPAIYNLTVQIVTTNDLGDYLQVLYALNESIGPFYRYETGTSMSAPAVSGLLALIQDYFTNTLHSTPSPALLKAMVINGSRAVNNYRFAVTNEFNFQGWGLTILSNSLPRGITNGFNAPCSSFFLDQDPTNALATGDKHTFVVSVTNLIATLFPLRVTLTWSDPPGDPAAAIKLVNNLDLTVSNAMTGKVYYGNNFLASGNPPFTSPMNATNAPLTDSINNVENVFISPLLSQPGPYYITVSAKSVNVNAVTAHTNNYVQDFALVVSCGEGEVTNAITVSDLGVSSNPTGYQDITYVATTNTPLFNQLAGGNTPLSGSTNTILLATNAQIILGVTNQWHFFVVTNTTTFTNAAFITFLPSTLAIPRSGVFADSTANATRPEADIDMYVARGSTIPNASALTNLDPAVVTLADKALGRSGTEFVAYTDAQPGEVYYIGIKSEDNEGAEFGFIPIFSEQPFSQQNGNGDVTVNGLVLPIPVPDGSPSHPGSAYVFGLAIQPVELARVVVTNTIVHQDFGDLIGVLSHDQRKVVLNNHTAPDSPTPPGPYTMIYDDSGRGDIPNSQPSSGPGSLQTWVGREGQGVWMLTEVDDALTQTGSVTGLTLFLEKHRDAKKGINVTIQPGSWFYTFVDVPVGITNLQVFATNLTVTPATPPLQLFLRYNAQPDLNNWDLMTELTNGVPPGNMLSDGPPLIPGRYYIGIFNPSLSAQDAFLLAVLNGPDIVVEPTDIRTNANQTISDDAISSSTMFISNTNPIGSVNVGVVVQHPRISDLTFTLISPTGQRTLLMENRGGLTATNAGHLNILTNYLGKTTAGNANASTNIIGAPASFGTLIIDYDFFTIPDTIDIYQDGIELSGFPQTASGPGTFTVPFNGISTNIVIVMNNGGNTNGLTAWEYTPRIVFNDYNYLTFTEDTNKTTVPIKFAIPPFDLSDFGDNYTLSDFETNSAGVYFAPTNIPDSRGGWYLPTNAIVVSTIFSNGATLFGTNTFIFTNNQVSVVTDPGSSFTGGTVTGTNFLALANGFMVRTNTLIPQRRYTINYLYRGPGISGWWRGEGDASDAADPERLGQNGSLIGRFDFPAGEVSQAFQLEDNGGRFDFAGTNSYVQIRQMPFLTTARTSESNSVPAFSSRLDVGTGSGFTIEGWINPTNAGFQQPLVEWLARVPTNMAVTNMEIVAGPFLNRDTGHYYYLLGATNWNVSEFWATQLGGHLATVDTANEQNWIFDAFGVYGGTNRNLWIGLTNFNAAQFGYVSGLTNVIYTNWFTGQPTNCGSANYTFISGNTNSFGLWFLSDSNGFVCGAPTITNKIFGVVEVDEIQTNGVQFWISVTNIPGTTNFVSGTNGCLFANIVDITNGWHIIVSPPDLVQSNVFQHVALTYDTNSGIANLYYQGTNVASTNLGYFIPKTTGDVLLGRDMSRLTNNFYGGRMDEMSIYSRALSPSEIYAIYNISASTTNRLIGKFDASVTPPLNLAEAQVVLGNMTNFVMGANDSWQSGGFTFTALTNSMIMQLLGLEPGILFDSFNVSITPIGNLYYMPEQSLEDLKDTSPFGTWSLEIWDNRVGAVVTNSLVSWQLQIVFETNTPPSVDVDAETPTTLTVPPGQTIVLNVDAPSWATFASNILVSASSPVDMFYNQSNAPTGTFPPDTSFLVGATAGVGVLTNVNIQPYAVPNYSFVPGQRYYLGIHNPGTHSAQVVVEVDFDITALTNDVIFNSTLGTNDTARYFSFDVASNAFVATFQLLKLSSNADLVLRKGTPLPTLTSSDYGSFNVSNLDENIYVLTNSSPVPLSKGRWFAGVIKRGDPVVNYTILAKELTNAPTIIPLQNGVPFDFTAGPGAALTNFFSFTVTNSSPSNLVSSVHFELYHLTGANGFGNGDLTVQTNSPPYAPQFFQSSQQPGTIPELIFIRTNTSLTNLATTYYLGVPNHETNAINFTIFAIVDTNLVFPAFPTTPSAPGAEGAGAGAAGGGRLGLTDGFGNPITNTVYHVTSLSDSGSGTLRDAVSSPYRTIVFDLSGPIFLQSPLVITNSYLTIAGQTAPGNGITVAGQMTELAGVHDVIIRDIRFVGCDCSTVVLSAGFEGQAQTFNATGYFSKGWHVDSGNVDIVGVSYSAAVPYEGTNFIDLNGITAGTISTNVSTVIGQTYILSFAYDKNPGASTAAANVLQNGNLLTTLTVTSTNENWGDLKWSTASISFTATSTITKVEFASQTSGSGGVVLDGVSLSTGPTQDLLQFNTVSNVIADHISTERSGMDLAVLNSTNVTLQWSIISDSLYNPSNSLAGYGSRLRYGGGVLSLHHNLYADNYTGSPRLGDNITLDFVNNVIYNWGTNSGFSTNDIADNPNGFTNRLNYIGNYLIAGTNAFRRNIAFWGGSTNTWIYQTNNFIDSDTNRFLNGANTDWNMFTNQFTKFDRAFSVPPVSVDEAFLAYEKVLALSGPNMGQRDSFDTNIVYKVRAQTEQSFVTTPTLPGLVGWWKGEGNAYDSALGNNGNVTNGTVTYTDGEVGQAFHIANSSYVDIPASSSLNVGLGPGFTVECWIRPSDIVNQSALVEWQYSIPDNLSGVHFDISTPAPNGGGPGCLYANITDTAGATHNLWTAGGVLTTNWQHVALTFDKTTRQACIYRNSILLTNVTFPAAFTPYTTKNLLLGARTFLSPPTPNITYQGDLDEVSVYKCVLSSNDIALIYNAGIAGKFASATNTAAKPYLDTDQDGLPDFWEMTFDPANVFVPNSNNDRNGDAYTDLEEYNNWLAGLHALTITNTPVGVDLQKLFGQTGNLSFSVTNAVNGSVYITNILGSVTNAGAFSNSFAVFTPTNDFGGGTNYGYASFDVVVTNNDTIAHFGPMTVSVFVSAVPIVYNTNMPPTIHELTSGIVTNLCNSGGSDFFHITVTTNDFAALFELIGATGMDLVVAYNRLPSLSSYDYFANTPPANPQIAVSTNSTPVRLQPGDWYMAAVNVSGSNICYAAKITKLSSIVPPLFLSPTNANIFTNIENYPLTISCVATDLDTPPLPLTFTLVNGPTNMSVSSSGLLNWTPSEAQGPSTNSISVSVANAAFSVTNTFTIIVLESNEPPVLPFIPDQFANAGLLLTITNTATDPDIPINPLTYLLLVAPTNAAIDANGIITWTPTPAQAGATYQFVTIVTDTNPPAVNATSLSATNSFFVTVQPSSGGGVPQTNTVPAESINWIAVNVPTNADWATNILLFADLPVNILFTTNFPPTTNNAITLIGNQTNGISILGTNTAPTNIVMGGTYYLGVQNTNVVPVNYAIEVDFHFITTNAANTNIVISSIISTNGGFLLIWFAPTNDIFQVQESDVLPPVWNTFSNIITWAGPPPPPTNGIGMFTFFDDGSQYPFGPLRFYQLILLQATNTLTLPAQTNYSASVGIPLVVTNTATDSNPALTLNYTLGNFPVPSALPAIDTNGIISWTPGAGDAGSAFKLTTIVTDDGLPPVSATNFFTVFVLPAPAFSAVISTSTNVTLTWTSSTNNLFQVESTTNLMPTIIWTPLLPSPITSSTGTFTFVDTNPPVAMKFYRLVWLPLP